MRLKDIDHHASLRFDYQAEQHLRTHAYLFSIHLISCCAIVNEKTSLGPTASTFGAKPLKNAPAPSCLMRSFAMTNPLGESVKLTCWILVLMTSSGWLTASDATAPHIEVTNVCAMVAFP